MSGWKTVKRKIVHKNPYYQIVKEDIVRPDGTKGKYFKLEKGNGVVIIAYNGKKIFFENLYRQAFRGRTWELPAGKSDSNNHLKEAKRELREETGITAKKWIYLGKFACGPGHTDHIGHVFLAENLSFGKHDREAGEQGMVIKGFTLRQIDTMITKGKIIDSWAITPLYFFKQYLEH